MPLSIPGDGSSISCNPAVSVRLIQQGSRGGTDDSSACCATNIPHVQAPASVMPASAETSDIMVAIIPMSLVAGRCCRLREIASRSMVSVLLSGAAPQALPPLRRNAAMTPETSTRDQDRHTSGRDPDDPVLFYAERSFLASAAKQGLLLLLWLPFLLALSEAIPIVLLSALGFALWQHSAFRFELTATHLWFRAGVFTSTILIPLDTICDVEPLDYRGEPLTWSQNAAVGSLRLGFPDGSSITVAGIREPREVVGAVRFLREFNCAVSGKSE